MPVESPHHRHSHGAAVDPGSALPALLDLDGVVLGDYWTEVITAVRQAVAGAPRRCVLDLGAGTGTGTIRLAQRFGGAEVVALDNSDDMLARIRVKALDLGLAPRVRTVRADLDAGLPDLGPVDVVWASMSLHHLADPDRLLADVRAAMRPGGVIAVAEMAQPVRFLPDDLGIGQPGLEARCLAALCDEHARAVPELGSDWAARLAAAGFSSLEERTLTIALDPPPAAATARYAHLWLQRLAAGVGDRLDADDRHTLAVLVDGDGPESVRHRDDLQIRGTRTLTLARR